MALVVLILILFGPLVLIAIWFVSECTKTTMWCHVCKNIGGAQRYWRKEARCHVPYWRCVDCDSYLKDDRRNITRR